MKRKKRKNSVSTARGRMEEGNMSVVALDSGNIRILDIQVPVTWEEKRKAKQAIREAGYLPLGAEKNRAAARTPGRYEIARSRR